MKRGAEIRDKGDVEFLDRFAHADLIGPLVVITPRPDAAEADLELLPQRGGVGPANQLLNAAPTAGMFSVVPWQRSSTWVYSSPATWRDSSCTTERIRWQKASETHRRLAI